MFWGLFVFLFCIQNFIFCNMKHKIITGFGSVMFIRLNLKEQEQHGSLFAVFNATPSPPFEL